MDVDMDEWIWDEICCPECNEFSDTPVNGFPRNRALENLLDKNIERIDQGQEYNSAFDKCSLFADLLERFNKIKNDPNTRINEEISELKNQVDMRREELKQKIDKESLEMIEKLEEFEKECILKSARVKCSLFSDMLKRFNKIKSYPETKISEEISDLKKKVYLKREEMSKESLEMIAKIDEFEKECKLKAASLKSDCKLNEKLKSWGKSLKSWQQSLNSFERNTDNWNRVLNESTSALKELDSEYWNFDKNLFLNRLSQFKHPYCDEFIALK